MPGFAPSWHWNLDCSCQTQSTSSGMHTEKSSSSTGDFRLSELLLGEGCSWDSWPVIPHTQSVWEVLMSVSASPSLRSRLTDSRLSMDFGLIAPLYSCPHGPLCAQMPALTLRPLDWEVFGDIVCGGPCNFPAPYPNPWLLSQEL